MVFLRARGFWYPCDTPYVHVNLTYQAIINAKPAASRFSLSDGRGLELRVTPSGKRTCAQRHMPEQTICSASVMTTSKCRASSGRNLG